MPQNKQQKLDHDLAHSMGQNPQSTGKRNGMIPLHLIALDGFGSLLIAAGILSFAGVDLPLVRLIEPNPVGILCIALGLGLMLPMILWIIQRGRNQLS